MKNQVYQIFYSKLTRRQLDSGFLPLDNLANARPDWREYWPIRQFLASNTLKPDTRYGFLAPKFFLKTHLSSKTVHAHLRVSQADVVTFNPFWEMSALQWNVVEQAELEHPGIEEVLTELLPCLDLPVSLLRVPMSYRELVYCNYFVAKPAFWARWGELADRIFQIAEDAQHPLSGRLCADTNYDGYAVPLKVFVVERLVSLLLTHESGWSVDAFFPGHAPDQPEREDWLLALGPPPKHEAILLDATKRMYVSTAEGMYREAFFRARNSILQRRRHLAIWNAGVNRAVA